MSQGPRSRALSLALHNMVEMKERARYIKFKIQKEEDDRGVTELLDVRRGWHKRCSELRVGAVLVIEWKMANNRQIC